MKILSLNVGLPREVTWQGKLVTTGSFKEPVKVPVMGSARSQFVEWHHGC
jgi:hypothetical protein